MSLSEKLVKLVDSVIAEYNLRIFEEFNISIHQLEEIWSNMNKPTESKKAATKSTPKTCAKQPEINLNDTHSMDHLISMKKPELQAICRERGIPCTGTKDELIKRIIAKKPSVASPAKTPAKTSTKTSPAKTPAKTSPSKTPTVTKAATSTAKAPAKAKATTSTAKSKPASSMSNITQKLMSKIPIRQIRKNQFGNMEHPETQLVFDGDTKTVIGKQNDDGSVDPLTAEDIDTCNRFKFEFQIPDNLDGKTNLNDEQVDELDDVEGVDDEEEIIEEDLLDDEEEEVDEEDEEDIEYDE